MVIDYIAEYIGTQSTFNPQVQEQQVRRRNAGPRVLLGVPVSQHALVPDAADAANHTPSVVSRGHPQQTGQREGGRQGACGVQGSSGDAQ